MNYANLTFLVSSCDKYAVCWAPFCHGLQKYWPDHPKKLIFITNHQKAPCGKSLMTGEDQGWAKNLQKALDQIETDFILYAQEDYWIKSPVPNEVILDYLDYLIEGQVDMIRLYPAPGPDKILEGDERLGVIAPDSKYRASLQMALWRKSTIKSLLDPDETPWQFEVKGTQRSQKYGGRFLCVSKRRFGVDYVFTAIKNGYWTDLAREYAINEEIFIAFEKLPKKPLKNFIYDQLRLFFYRIKKYIKNH